MEVVINRCFGGFSLSNEAIALCVQKGMTIANLADKDKKADFIKYTDGGILNRDDKLFRTNKIVIEVVKKLGKRADGEFASLEIIEIPFDDTNYWEIESFDGKEKVAQSRSFYY